MCLCGLDTFVPPHYDQELIIKTFTKTSSSVIMFNTEILNESGRIIQCGCDQAVFLNADTKQE